MIQNSVLGLVHEIQRSSYPAGPFGVDLDHSPDFAKLAEAYGIPSGRVTCNEDIPAAIETMLRTPGPYLLCCIVDPEIRTGD